MTQRDRVDNQLYRIRTWIDAELSVCKKLHYRFARRLGTMEKMELPERISYTTKLGKKYYNSTNEENGKRRTRYLGTEDSVVVQQTQEKRFLKKALSELDMNISDLESAMNSLRVFNVKEVNRSLPKSYIMSDELLAKVAGLSEEERWYTAALKEKEISEKQLSDFFKSGRKHSAKDGTKLRSKSEVIIANALIDKEIKYIYESTIKINNMPLHPDFVFYSYSRSRPLIWEHAGMMGDEKYRKEFADKLSAYIEGGYIPCVDIIFSFDTTDGNVDSELIDRLIEEYM